MIMFPMTMSTMAMVVMIMTRHDGWLIEFMKRKRAILQQEEKDVKFQRFKKAELLRFP